MDIRLQNNLQIIIDNFGDDYVMATNHNIAYRCPFCESDGDTHTDRKLYVSYSNLKYLCFRCGRAGRVNIDDILCSNSNVCDSILQLIQSTSSNPSQDDEDEDELFFIPKYRPLKGSQAYEYIRSRGISDDDIEFYDIRVPSTKQPHLFGRFIVPNQVVGKVFTDMYVARTYIGDSTRYKNSLGAKRNQIVFNLHRIPDNPPCIIINEGAINSIIAGRLSVATYGKFVSDTQLKMILAKNPQSIYVSLDTDARKYAMKVCRRIRELSPRTPVYPVELPDNKDASDLGHDLYMKYILDAHQYQDYSTYVIQNYLKSLED